MNQILEDRVVVWTVFLLLLGFGLQVFVYENDWMNPYIDMAAGLWKSLYANTLQKFIDLSLPMKVLLLSYFVWGWMIWTAYKLWKNEKRA